MKRIFLIIAAIAILGVGAWAAMDVYDTVTVTTVSAPKLATGIETNTAVDVYFAKGTCHLLVTIGPSYTNGTSAFGANATLKTSATSAGTYVTVTNGAGSAVAVTGTATNELGATTSVKVEASQLKRYVKLYTISTNDTCIIGAELLSPK